MGGYIFTSNGEVDITNTMECFDADFDHSKLSTAHLTTIPFKVKYENISIRLLHLDVEDQVEELPRQLSYAIKNQLVASKAPY